MAIHHYFPMEKVASVVMEQQSAVVGNMLVVEVEQQAAVVVDSLAVEWVAVADNTLVEAVPVEKPVLRLVEV